MKNLPGKKARELTEKHFNISYEAIRNYHDRKIKMDWLDYYHKIYFEIIEKNK